MTQGTAPERDSSEREPAAGSTRRGLLAGAGLLGVAGAVAACGGGEDATAQPSGGSGGGGTGSGGGGGDVLARTSEIPVGGGKVIRDRKVVITQPVQGEFKAFDIKCTHRGCPVDSVDGGTINCPCHGSRFAIADGSVKSGPAGRPLPEKQITIEGGAIRPA